MKIIKIGRDPLDPAVWGFKGSRLADLMRAMLTIPDSWSVESEGLLSFLKVTELQRLARFADRHPEGYAESYARWQREVLARAFPAEACGFLQAITAELPKVEQWIVRSNHGGEDHPLHSFAGVYRSVVVPTSVDALMDAIKEVCIQAFSWEVQMQWLRTGADPLTFRPGVLIQPFIEGVRSGVYFSRHPENPWKGEALCEWVFGGAQPLVEGEGEVHREVWNPETHPAEAPLKQVHEEGRRIAEILGCSIDGEWVWDGMRLFWVQARPITDALSRLADRLDPTVVLSRDDMKERFPQPLSRMGWSVLDKILAVNLRSLEQEFGLVVPPMEEIVVNHSGTIYSNRAFFQLKGVKWKKSFLRRLLRPIRLCRILGDYLIHRQRAIFLLRLKDLFLGRTLDLICEEWEEKERESCLEEVAHLAAGSDEQLAEAFERLEALSQAMFSHDMATFVLREVYYGAFKKILGSDEELQGLLNKERTLNQELFADWEALKKGLNEASHPAFLERLKAGELCIDLLGHTERTSWESFMKKWGTTNHSWDVKEPGWQEDPVRLHSFLRTPTHQRSATAPKKGQAAERLKRWGLEPLFDKLVRIVKTDDREHYFGSHLLALARQLILEGARRLVERGALTHPEQVFGLTVDEVKGWLKREASHSLVPYAESHLQVVERAKARAFPHILNHPDAPVEEEKNKLGVPVSAGRVEGKLCIVRSLEDLDGLDDDSILALVSPNPAFIPLFSQVKGLVCETGGLLSHSFVVAREIMLPAITQVKGLTGRFSQGERVVMDGATGEIKKVACEA